MAASRRFFGPLCCVLLVSHALLASVSAYTQLSDDSLNHIPSGGADFDIHHGALLSPILIPRVPGTPGSQKVQDHITSFFASQLPKWTVEWHNSTSTTPATGSIQVPFRNLIIRRDPPWAAVGDVGHLTLAAHYDSLYRPDGFIGATDSAAPCAMLMHVARSVDEALTRKWAVMQASGEAGDGLEEEKGVQVIFFDGEEAWEQWSTADSLYGSRALAESWEAEQHPPSSVYKTPLSSISLFMLLDLLGAADPRVPSYFQSTHWAYQHLSRIESRMRALGALETKPAHRFLPDEDRKWFKWSMGYVEDDHVPFMARGVDILHVIPTPFPHVWHTMSDDGPHLDIPTVRDWARIMTAFVAEWMELDGLLPPLGEEKGYGSWSEKTEL